MILFKNLAARIKRYGQFDEADGLYIIDEMSMTVDEDAILFTCIDMDLFLDRDDRIALVNPETSDELTPDNINDHLVVMEGEAEEYFKNYLKWRIGFLDFEVRVEDDSDESRQ